MKTSDQRHGGNLRALAAEAGLPASEIIDFSANINPLGPPAWLRPIINSSINSLVHYPDPDSAELVKTAARHYGATANEVLAGNGSTELLYLLARALKPGRAVIPVPSYVDYARAARVAEVPVATVLLREEKGFALDAAELRAILREGDMVIIGRPNNPTGLSCDGNALRTLALAHPKTSFVIDEAFGGFVAGFDSLTQRRPANAIVLLSLTKLYAIPGLRLGCAIASADTAALVREIQPPWSVNTLAQAVGATALEDREYVSATQEYIRLQREHLREELLRIPGLTAYAGEANFLLVRLERADVDAPELARRTIRKGIAIRVCDNFAGLDGRFFRVAVRTAEQNDRLCAALREALEAPAPSRSSAAPKARPS